MKKTIATIIGMVVLGWGQVAEAQWDLYWRGIFRVETTSPVQVQLVDPSGNPAGQWNINPGQCGNPIQRMSAPLQAHGSFCSDLATIFYRLRYRTVGGQWITYRIFSLGTIWNAVGCQECDTVNGSQCGAPELPWNFTVGTVYVDCPTPTPTPTPTATPTPTPTATPLPPSPTPIICPPGSHQCGPFWIPYPYAYWTQPSCCPDGPGTCHPLYNPSCCYISACCDENGNNCQ